MVDDGLAVCCRDGHQEVDVRRSSRSSAGGSRRSPPAPPPGGRAGARRELFGRRARDRTEDDARRYRCRLASPSRSFSWLLRSEPWQVGDTAFAAGALESRRRVDPELLEQDAQALRSEPRDAQQILNSGRELGAQLGMQRERAGEHDLRDAARPVPVRCPAPLREFRLRRDPADLPPDLRWRARRSRRPGSERDSLPGARAGRLTSRRISAILRAVNPRRGQVTGVGHARGRGRAGLSRLRPELHRRRRRRRAARRRDRSSPR